MPIEFDQEDSHFSVARSMMQREEEQQGLAGLLIRLGWFKSKHSAEVFLMSITLLMIFLAIGIYFFGQGRKNPGMRFREGIPVEDLRLMPRNFQIKYVQLPTPN